jgi:hypothetical protein
MKEELTDLPLEFLPVPLLTGPASSISPWVEKVEVAMKGSATSEDAEKAWAAWLGCYNSMSKQLGWTKEALVQASLEYALSIGLPRMPSIPKRTVSKMGLVGVPGLVIVADTPGGRPGGGRGGGSAVGRGSSSGGGRGGSSGGGRGGGSTGGRGVSERLRY